ncbi:MAG: hypothetical protein OXF27_06350 [Acidobacteria bacterium]|nr:hypothetical protein [Acidobacteriota bacterium]
MPSVPPPASGSSSAAESRGGSSAAWLERWFLRIALGVGAVAWIALLLAELGQFHISLLAALVAAGIIGLVVQTRLVRRERAARPSARVGAKSVAAFLAVTVLGAALYFPAYDSVVFGDDASVYLSFGRKIAETGRLVFDDPLLREIPADAREDLFLNRQPRDMTGRYARFPGGFLIADIADPAVTAGFSPLFPVLTAVFYEAVPARGAPAVTPLFAVLSLGGLFLVGASIGGIRTGLLAAVLLGVSLPQIWFAKYPVPDIVAQFFVVSGLLALLAAFRDDRPWLAAAAGGLFGMACFAKVDMIVLLTVTLTAFAAWRLLSRPAGGERCVTYLFAASGVMLAHNLLHYLLFPSHYTRYVEELITTSYLFRLLAMSPVLVALFVAAVLAFAALAVGVARWRGMTGAAARQAGGFVLVGLLAAYAVNYVATNPGRFPDTILWLSWYMSWPVLVLCVIALVWLLRSGRAGKVNQGLSFLLLLLAVVSLHYLYDPLEDGDHIWSMRRFVPVVLPGLLLILATAAGRLIDWIYVEYRTAATVTVGLILVALLGRPSLAVAGEPLWDGALEQSAALARIFPENATVLVSPELAGTHVQTSLAYLHDVDTILIQEQQPGELLRDVVLDWMARGREVFIVIERQGFSFPAPDLTLSEFRNMRIDVLTLEQTLERLPQALVESSARMRILQVARADGVALPARTAVNIGNPTDDIVSNLEGFYAAEQDPAAGPYRWTRELASFAIPAGGRVMLVVAGARPAGAPPAGISVWTGRSQIADSVIIENQPQTITLDIPPSEQAGPTELMIRSSIFQPESLGLSPDTRNLGVRVYRADILPAEPDEPDPDTPEASEPPAATR